MTMNGAGRWVELDYGNWRETAKTLHLWTQIVGKVRLSKSPRLNHSWSSTLYVTERGLTTSLIHADGVSFAIDFDFIAHVLRISRSDGRVSELRLAAEPVASFHEKCLGALSECGIATVIHGAPNELPEAVPFAQDFSHRAYDPEYAQRFWRVLLECDRVMKQFRSLFSGKVSPVHFFWGSFDLALTRFSGRRAPEHPGGVPHLPDLITREAYSHEVSSVGFWPGSDAFPRAAFYSYAYPQPAGFEAAPVPIGAYYDARLREFILPYYVVRASRSPDALLAEFFQRTYDAAADLGHWDREALENSPYLKALQTRKSKTERKAA
ncbi:MAG: DUF5996 family protein [Oligoflexia bacterium]|nr:DUF5996 family protein [Oligoflexia bacterium]